MADQSEPVDLSSLSEEEDLVIATMVVIIAVGTVVELGLSPWDRRVRGRRGLLVTT